MLKEKSNSKQANQALAKTFKKKIENLIVQNLKDINLLGGEISNEDKKGLPVEDINRFYAENLNQILTSHKYNPSEKPHIILDRKSVRSVQRIQHS